MSDIQEVIYATRSPLEKTWFTTGFLTCYWDTPGVIQDPGEPLGMVLDAVSRCCVKITRFMNLAEQIGNTGQPVTRGMRLAITNNLRHYESNISSIRGQLRDAARRNLHIYDVLDSVYMPSLQTALQKLEDSHEILLLHRYVWKPHQLSCAKLTRSCPKAERRRKSPGGCTRRNPAAAMRQHDGAGQSHEHPGLHRRDAQQRAVGNRVEAERIRSPRRTQTGPRSGRGTVGFEPPTPRPSTA